MNTTNDEIQKLNQIAAIIDEKAKKYKDDRHHMSTARADAEKKLILDLIEDGIKLAKLIGKGTSDLLYDLERLKKQFIGF